MKSLHEEVRQRRAAESAALECISVQPAGPALVVSQWRRESWVLPWAQFIGARLVGGDGCARLELSFANYRVIVAGENLAGLLDDLAAQRLGYLRDLPTSYRARFGEGAPFIASIEVHPVGGGSPSEIHGTP